MVTCTSRHAAGAAGVREVGIPAAIIPDLREYPLRWSEPGSNGLVFVGAERGDSRRSNFTRLWKVAAADAGTDPEVGLRFHDLHGGPGAPATGPGRDERRTW